MSSIMTLQVFALCLISTVSCLGKPNNKSTRYSEFFSLIVLPDTQGYADIRHKETQKHWPDIGDQRSCFFTQTEWIRENRRKLNIVMVVHVGDITQTDYDEEWKIVYTAFKTIDNYVPYILKSSLKGEGFPPRKGEGLNIVKELNLKMS